MLIKIGELARLAGVTVKTLRYYDRLGLLRPVQGDPMTGYRYYSRDQLPRLNRILALKDLDLSLDQIVRLLDNQLSADEIRGMLVRKKIELERQVKSAQIRLSRVEARLCAIEKETGDGGGNRQPVTRVEAFSEGSLSDMQSIHEANFDLFLKPLKQGQAEYLPMIFGTVGAAQEQTAWLEIYSNQYVWLVDTIGQDTCLYALRRSDDALWVSFLMPSDWSRRYTLVASSLPRLMDWFRAHAEEPYLYGQIGAAPYPPTLLESFLPSFLDNGFRTEYRMTMRRPANIPVPPPASLPEGVTVEGYRAGLDDEIVALTSATYTLQDVLYTVADARDHLAWFMADDLFQKSGMFLRDREGQLIGATWACVHEDSPHLGELVVLQTYQGQGFGRYLLNEVIRTMAAHLPERDIRIETSREWRSAARLYESYGFLPTAYWVNLNWARANGKPS